MVRIKIYQIVHVENFIELIEKSHSNVLWYLTDGTVRNLKKDYIARQLVIQETEIGHAAEIALLDTKDYLNFVNFMTGGC